MKKIFFLKLGVGSDRERGSRIISILKYKELRT